MISVSGRHVIIYNGEVYNFEEIRADLGPHRWRGHSDTEVILEAFDRWGAEAAVQRFVGMFAIALWDRLERRLYLVRDRLGIKPLYYGRAGDAFVFGSELKAICQHPEFSAEIDRDALALYMRHNYVPSPHCIYKGLRKLQPGCLLTLDSAESAPTISQYWSAEQIALSRPQPLSRANDADTVDELHELLLRAVRLRMIADVPLGAFLSGGVDSSAVVALMQAQSSCPVKTFTIGFHDEEYNEAVDAKRVAEHLRTDHTELYLSPKDAQDVIPLLAAMYDEPFSDSSQIPTFLVSKLARRSVTVSLSGDGGDELFGGYTRYQLTRKIWNVLRFLPKSVRNVTSSALHAVPLRQIDSGLQMLFPLMRKSREQRTIGDKAHKLANVLSLDGPEALYNHMLSHWKKPSEIVLGSSEPNTFRESISKVFNSAGVEDAMMIADLLNYLPDDILTKVDRASMAVSLEARVPLLDHRVVEFALRLPLRLKVRKGTTKWILRQVLHRYVPPQLIERPKMGFGVPIGRWLRSELRDWAEHLLSPRSLSDHGFFDVNGIREKWDEHLSGARNWQNLLWDVLVFQDWVVNGNSRRSTCETNYPSEKGFAQAGTH